MRLYERLAIRKKYLDAQSKFFSFFAFNRVPRGYDCPFLWSDCILRRFFVLWNRNRQFRKHADSGNHASSFFYDHSVASD